MIRIFTLLLCILSVAQAQVNIDLKHEASADFPYGTVHPDYEEYLKDFAPMIGRCECKSVNRNAEGNFTDTIDMIWQFKYIMNGSAIQDETWKADGRHSGSIRQFQPDSSQWVVTYFSQPGVTYTPGVWIGGKDGDDIVLKMDQTAPNGTEGISRLTFSNISASGYDWIAEWTSLDESFVHPIWKIYCKKQKE